jgi:hypothetical protein
VAGHAIHVLGAEAGWARRLGRTLLTLDTETDSAAGARRQMCGFFDKELCPRLVRGARGRPSRSARAIPRDGVIAL